MQQIKQIEIDYYQIIKVQIVQIKGPSSLMFCFLQVIYGFQQMTILLSFENTGSGERRGAGNPVWLQPDFLNSYYYKFNKFFLVQPESPFANKNKNKKISQLRLYFLSFNRYQKYSLLHVTVFQLLIDCYRISHGLLSLAKPNMPSLFNCSSQVPSLPSNLIALL